MDVLGKIEFRLFYFFMLIVDDLNQSFSLVQYERFRRERLYYMITGKELKYKSEIEDKKRSRRRLFDDLRWMLEYNQNGLMSLFIYTVHISILVSFAAQALIYSSFPTERDPKTGLFVNDYLRFVEAWLFIDSLHLFDSSGLFNRLVLVVLLRFLTLRIRALCIKIQRAKKNRYGYKSINIVDINLCNARAFRNRLKGAIQRVYGSLTHDCCSRDSLSGNERKATLEFNRKVRKLDKMDRIYFYNQISFNKCFRKLDLFDKYYRDIKPIDTKLARESINYVELAAADAFFEDVKPKASWLENVFRVDLPNRIGYLPPPEYRLDLGIGAGLLCIYGAYIVFVALLLIFSVVTSTLGIARNSKNEVRIQPFILTQAIKSLLLAICVIINGCDNMQLIYSSIVVITRSQKIVKLIKRENMIYRTHSRQFAPFYDKYRTNYVVDQDIVSDDENFIESVEYCTLLLAYKQCLPRIQVKEFNENLDYILDLIEVMLVELEDYKSLFTTYLDINIVFGVVELSVALALILNSDNIVSPSMAYFFAYVSLAGLYSSLFAGASIELAFSSIYRNLSPFLVNEFSFVDHKVHSRMFKICQKIVLSVNRSYIILGIFPLTVGSLPSILGWITTVTILIQRFII